MALLPPQVLPYDLVDVGCALFCFPDVGSQHLQVFRLVICLPRVLLQFCIAALRCPLSFASNVTMFAAEATACLIHLRVGTHEEREKGPEGKYNHVSLFTCFSSIWGLIRGGGGVGRGEFWSPLILGRRDISDRSADGGGNRLRERGQHSCT